jgi:spermidine/putrescine transport system substrate-binding protein
VNTGDPALIDAAKDAILETIDQNKAKLTINGVYAKLPAGDFTVAESWSGDIVGAQWYLPKDVDWDVLGYWRPEPGQTMTDNDLIAIPTGATNPRLAHEFINFFLDEKVAYDNFRYWNGYQPPLTSIEPDKLIDDGVVPPNLPMAVVSQEMFEQDLTPIELAPEVDQLWQAAWTEITS